MIELLDSKIEKKNSIKKWSKKNESNQLGLTFQTRNLDHEIRITSLKANKKNYEDQLNKYSMKKWPKNKVGQPRNNLSTRDSGHEIGMLFP
jgi:hypothetical protein